MMVYIVGVLFVIVIFEAICIYGLAAMVKDIIKLIDVTMSVHELTKH